jgi:FKBP-type peptidyl-prolyl cis-trans isomerase
MIFRGEGAINRLCGPALLLPLLWTIGTAQADEGIPALLQFAEEYSNQQSATGTSGANNKVTETPQPKKSRFEGIADNTALSAGRESTSPTLRRALKQRDTQLAQQQATLRAQEKQLAELRQTLKTLRAKPQTVVDAPPVTWGTPTDFTPLQQWVAGLRDAVSGSPEARRSAELITQFKQKAERSDNELTHSQAQVRALKVQLGDLKKHLLDGGENVTREQQSRLALQAKLDGLQAQLDEKMKTLQTVKQQFDVVNSQRTVLEGGLTKAQEKLDTRLQQADATLMAERMAHEKVIVDLKTKLGAVEQSLNVQQSEGVQKETELVTLRATKEGLQAKHDALQQQANSVEARLAKRDQEAIRLQEDVNGLRTRAKWLMKPDALNQPEKRQAYAAGSALGHDIIEMLDERKSWGVNADRQTVLSGLIDAFSGQYQLTTDVLAKALADSETSVNTAREKAVQTQQKKGETFVADFKKQKGVKQSAAGFLYRVTYLGDDVITDDAVVDVVVKESLIDGTVIQDMDLEGNVLSQSLKAYPPLFREAIGHLRNHGTLTMVVPPALAYGEAGYPPKVPPNATMVYELRVDGIKAATVL